MSKVSTIKHLGISSFEVHVNGSKESERQRFTCDPESLYSKIEAMVYPRQLNISKEDFMDATLAGRPNAVSYRWFPEFSVTMLEHHFSKASSVWDLKVSGLKGYIFNVKNTKTSQWESLTLGDDESVVSFYRRLVKVFGSGFMTKSQFYSVTLFCHKRRNLYKVYTRGFEITATKATSAVAPVKEELKELRDTGVTTDLKEGRAIESISGNAIKTVERAMPPYEVNPSNRAVQHRHKPNTVKVGFITKLLNFFKK